MGPVHDERSAIPTAVQGDTATRRRVVAGAAALATALAVGRAAGAGWQDFADDVEVLNLVLRIEHLEAALYREGLRAFDPAAFVAGDRPDTLRPQLEAIRDQEQAHVEELVDAIAEFGGVAIADEGYDFAFSAVDDFIQLAAQIETIGVAAYAGALAVLSNRSLLPTVLGLHSVEARHSAYLSAQAGESPFPNVIDPPLAPAEAASAIAGYYMAESSEDDTAGGPPPTESPPAQEPADDDTGPDGADRRFADVIADAADRQGVDPADVTIVQTERRDWSDSSLGCPEPGGVYAQVITPGFLVIVEAGGVELEYHTDRRGNFVLCQ